MSEGDPAIGLGQAMFDVVRLQVRERDMVRTIRDQAQLLTDHKATFIEVTNRLKARIKELEEERLGQQVADEKVKYMLLEAQRLEKNELITRAGWQTLEERVTAAIALLEKHDCQRSCDGTPERALELLKPPVLKPIYTAIFLDEESKETLLKAFPPIHPKVFGHHVTLAFKPSPELVNVYAPYLGHEVVFEVVGEAADAMGQAVKVTVPKPYGDLWSQVHHVTISCVGTPVYSNQLLALGWQTVPPLKLKGILRHFTG